jgi:hypothetical protein
MSESKPTFVQELLAIANKTHEELTRERRQALACLLPTAAELESEGLLGGAPVLKLIDPEVHHPDYAKHCLTLLRDVEIEHGRVTVKLNKLIAERGSQFRYGEKLAVLALNEEIIDLTEKSIQLNTAMADLMGHLAQGFIA